MSICLKSGPKHKLGLARPSLCLGSEKKIKVRVTKLPDHQLSSSHGRKEEGLVMNIYTVGQVHHSKGFFKKTRDQDEAIDTLSRSL